MVSEIDTDGADSGKTPKTPPPKTQQTLANPQAEGTLKALRQSTANSLNSPLRQSPFAKRISVTRGNSSRSVGSNRRESELYVDQLRPEDVGFSFCIRAPADFSDKGAPVVTKRLNFDGDVKHLYGLSDIFPLPTDENVKTYGRCNSSFRKNSERDAAHALQGATSSFSLASMMKGVKTKSRKIAALRVVPAAIKRAVPQRMRFAATSSVAMRTQLFLSSSAIFSCIYVIFSCAVEASCHHRGLLIPVVKYAHLLNSILYGLLAIPSRCFFTRIDFRIGEEIRLPKDVLRSQLTSPGLAFDFLALFGLFAEIAHHFEDSHSTFPLPTPGQWTMLLQLLKVWRIALPEDTGDDTHGFFSYILRLLLRLMAFSHVEACCFLLVGSFEVAQGGISWLDFDPYDLDMTDCVVRYTEAYYFAVIGLTSVGYEDVLVTPLEHGFNAVFLLTSQLFAAQVCAALTWLTSMYNQHEADVHERRRSLVLALDKMGVSKVLVKRVLAFQSYENSMHADNMEKETFQGLGQNLMEELRLCAYRKLVIQAPFLREQPTEVISFIVKSLYDAVYLPADFIVRAGEHGRELYFVRRGEARAYLGPEAPVWGRSDEVAIIKAGYYFGELAMLTGLPRASYVMATSYCICSVLPYYAIEDLMEMHPEAFTTLVQTMVKMYNLKPDISWKTLSSKIAKKYGLYNDFDAFLWLQSHADNPAADDLNAKAFDFALQKLKVSHLDRRIFWAELDKDASGGISFEEFAGKLEFPCGADGGMQRQVSIASGHTPIESPSVSESAPDSPRCPGDDKKLFKRMRSLSVLSEQSQSQCMLSFPSPSSGFDRTRLGNLHHIDQGVHVDGSADKAIELLTEQNRRLSEALQRAHLRKHDRMDHSIPF